MLHALWIGIRHNSHLRACLLLFLFALVPLTLLSQSEKMSLLNDALHKAILAGNAEETGKLLENGANPNAKDARGVRPLTKAIRVQNLEIMNRLMRAGAQVQRADVQSTQSDPKKQQLLLFYQQNQEKEKKESTGVISAVQSNNLGALKNALGDGGSMDARSADGKTALLIAIERGNSRIANFLIESGADINLADHDNMTPLRRAIQVKHLQLISQLLKHSAIVTDEDIASTNDVTIRQQLREAQSKRKSGEPAPNEIPIQLNLTFNTMDEYTDMLLPLQMLRNPGILLMEQKSITSAPQRYTPLSVRNDAREDPGFVNMMTYTLIPVPQLNPDHFTLFLAFMIDPRAVYHTTLLSIGLEEEWFTLRKEKTNLSLSLFGNEPVDIPLQAKSGIWCRLIVSFNLKERQICFNLNGKFKVLRIGRNDEERYSAICKKMDASQKCIKFYSIYPHEIPQNIRNDIPQPYQPAPRVMFHGQYDRILVGDRALPEEFVKTEKFKLLHAPQAPVESIQTRAMLTQQILDLCAREEIGEDDLAFLKGKYNRTIELGNLLPPQEPDKRIYQDAGGTLLTAAILKKNHKLLQTLLANGAKPNRIDVQGRTPLHYAVIQDDMEAVKILLDNGADINLAGRKTYRTPFLEMCMRATDLKMAHLLLDRGANPNVVDIDRMSPVNYAIRTRQDKLLKLLIDKKVDLRLDNAILPLDLIFDDPNLMTDEKLILYLLDNGAEATSSHSKKAKGQSLKKKLRAATRGK